ncbi:iron-containing alcohol dehydrogenase family protein [Petralouisia muris]|uniref:iron-containing alcohol dehydrogenase family protein n=1 Tax=Petralouisia muris TaxID=3032872 RepID=UPI001440EF18|nr:iron-containing alcohol dehydrogenase family protein [Petralouisia muris]
MAEARSLEEIKLDYAWKFGCGRYIQQREALETLPEEIKRLGDKPLIIAGPRAWEATEGRIEKALREAGIEYVLSVYPDQNTYEKAREHASQAVSSGCDVIVGVGGGRIMDQAKASAYFAGEMTKARSGHFPVVQVPTSIATCAAFAPLSVMYTQEGASLGSLRHNFEVNAIVVDLDVIVKEPARYVASGILDGMAKMVEMQNGHDNITIEEFDVGLVTAFTLAKYTMETYRKRGVQAVEDVRAGKLTKEVEDITYLNIAVAGVISGCSKGFGQTALGHECYELIRTHFTQEAKDFIHGEIVAVGQSMQLSFNGQEDQIPALREMMNSFDMPLTLKDIGIEPTEENVETLYQDLYHSPFVKDCPEEAEKLRKAMKWLCE